MKTVIERIEDFKRKERMSGRFGGLGYFIQAQHEQLNHPLAFSFDTLARWGKTWREQEDWERLADRIYNS